MDDFAPLHPAVRGLKTVCRCNNIKQRTIEGAIREGACTVAEIAKRTGATTGYCGGTCTPDVIQMIAELAPASPVSCAVPSPIGNPDADAWWVRKK